jgi:hypothetical protein
MHPLERRVQGVKDGEERFCLTTHQMMSMLEKESVRHKMPNVKCQINSNGQNPKRVFFGFKN